MALLETAEVILSQRPDRLVMVVPGLHPRDARRMATQALRQTRRTMPKMTGDSAKRMTAVYGQDYFGVKFQDSYVWFQENGIRSFTMNNLQGKTIPMWIDDPSGMERSKNPKAKTRTTASGKTQVLIFRKVAMKGQRKSVVRKGPKGIERKVDVPMSYPGAPGRIAHREASQPHTTPGRKPGAIAKNNIGVRWRHPGLQPRLFMNHALTVAAQQNGVLPVRVYATDGGIGVPR